MSKDEAISMIKEWIKADRKVIDAALRTRHKAEIVAYYMRSIEVYQTAIKALEALKQLEQRQGKWNKNDNGTYSCSLCHSWIPSEQHYYAKYCLHCGAEMEN